MGRGGDLKIIKLKDYDNEGGSSPEDALKLLSAKNLRPLTPSEWLSLSDGDFRRHKLHPYTPVFLKEPDGPLVRGDGDLGVRIVRCGVVFGDFVGDGRPFRFGVVGTPKTKGKHKHA